jgi:hypothetical protein
MKTSTEGNPVINRHRPYSKNQFSQRYLRLVDAPLWEDLDTNTDCAHRDPKCSCIRCDQYDYDLASKSEIARQEIRNILHRYSQTTMEALLPPELWASLGWQSSKPHLALPPLKADRIRPERLPIALAQYAAHFDHNYQTQYPLPDALLDFFADEEVVEELFCINQTMLQWSQDALVDFLLLQPFWVRDLHTWVDPQTNPKERLRSLIDHLFVVYPVPEFLYNGWNRRPQDTMGSWWHKSLDPRDTWIQWFILLAQGGSLHDAGSFLGWDLPRKYSHFLQQVPAHLKFQDACLFAEMQVLGITQLPFARIQGLNCFNFEPLFTTHRITATAFARETLVWLDRHTAALSDTERELVMDYAIHLVTEAERAGEINFSWQGRSAARVLELSRAYEASRYIPYSNLAWKRKGWDATIPQAQGGKWTVTELCNGRELYQEGHAMRHCVSSYAYACANNRSAIFSLRCDDLRKVTIELNLPSKKVAQAKGPCNRNADAREMAIIATWLASTVRV